MLIASCLVSKCSVARPEYFLIEALTLNGQEDEMKKARKIMILMILIAFMAGCQPTPPPDPGLTGPYQVGNMRNVTYSDPSRQDREVSIFLWYPAIIPKDTTTALNNYDVKPDGSGAPYPVIVMSAWQFRTVPLLVETSPAVL